MENENKSPGLTEALWDEYDDALLAFHKEGDSRPPDEQHFVDTAPVQDARRDLVAAIAAEARAPWEKRVRSEAEAHAREYKRRVEAERELEEMRWVIKKIHQHALNIGAGKDSKRIFELCNDALTPPASTVAEEPTE